MRQTHITVNSDVNFCLWAWKLPGIKSCDFTLGNNEFVIG